MNSADLFFFFVCVFVMSYINVLLEVWKWKRQYRYMKNNNVVASFSFLTAFQPFQTFVASWSQTPGHLFTAFWLRSPRANPSTKASACCPQGRRCTMTTQAPHHRQKGTCHYFNLQYWHQRLQRTIITRNEILNSSFKLATYTEHQKKLITSSEWRSLKCTPSKLIIFEHR